MKKLIVTCLLGFGVSCATSIAGDLPPEGSKPLAELLKNVEETLTAVVTEAEFDDGELDLKIVRNGAFERLVIDPRSGETLRQRETSADDRPPEDALPLSEIVSRIDAEGVGTVTEIDFDDDGHWEAEVRNGRREIELKVDPRSGEIRRD